GARSLTEDVAGAFEIGVQHLVGAAGVGGNHCRTMNDGVTAIECRRGGRVVGDVTDDVVADVDADLLGAGGEPVGVPDQEPDLVSGLLGCLRCPCTDETGAAGDEYLHVPPPIGAATDATVSRFGC